MLQCAALCCSVLQCGAVVVAQQFHEPRHFCVLQCVAVCCSVLQCVAVRCSDVKCVACGNIMSLTTFCVVQCVAVCVAVMYSALHAAIS